MGDLPAGCALSEESIALWRGTGDRRGLARALNNLALNARLRGDFAASRTAAEEELALGRTLPDAPFWTAMATRQLGRLAFEEDDTDRARALLGESLALYRDLNDPWQTAQTLFDLAHVALAAGDGTQASTAAAECLMRFQELGMGVLIAATHLVLGHAARLADDGREAVAAYAASLTGFRTSGSARFSVYALAGLAWTALWLGRPVQAARLLAAARTLPSVPSALGDRVTQPFYERDIATARDALGEAAFAAAWAEGEALSADQATAEALTLARELASP
jgi:ATP/maltotriose-dependent transcriptional regulator MalT